ncbi:MAG: Mut7-C RNAse domain-containing protein [Thermoproteota archaeon]|jgi:uncharacterized protein with PIN domain
MKFVVDGMHGKVAKWLRLLGFDVFYSATISDEELIDVTQKNRAILITSDEELYYRAIKLNLQAFLLKVKRKKLLLLNEILKTLNISYDELNIGSRCIICNTQLVKIEKEKVVNILPKKAIEKNSEFWYCEKCNKYYWYGSHWKNIEKELKQILNYVNR